MSIELEHSFDVTRTPDQAWDVLLDVQRVAPCMPGATVESVDGDEVSGKIKVKVGPITMTYTGKATFTERDDAAHSVKIEADGRGDQGCGHSLGRRAGQAERGQRSDPGQRAHHAERHRQGPRSSAAA